VEEAMKLRHAVVVGGLLLSVVPACGDDGDDTSSDAGTPEAGKGSAGKGGASGKSGAAGSAGKAGAGSAGKAGAPAGGSGGQSASGDETITIRFKGKVGDQDFACNKTYSGVGSKSTTIKPMDFRFFVQDVKLIDDKDKEVPVKLEVRAPWQSETVALVDFEDGAGLCASEGNSETNLTITGTVPKGSYKAITFVNGVPENLNHNDPAKEKDPLKTYAGMSWGWLLGFRFTKIEAAGPSDADGSVPGALLHLGSVGCTNADTADGGMDDYMKPPAIACTKPNRNKIKLSNYKVGESVIVADLAKLFEQTDLSIDSSCHSIGDACPNIIPKIGVSYPEGQPLSTQSFYRIE
jgi:uncharacterized repeat protein (TIGR04052 family)